MITRYSFKSLFRTPIKTILFFVLLVAITVFLILGISMLKSSTNLLHDADEQFITVAQLDYRGKNYPDASSYDEDLLKAQEELDISQFKDDNYTLSYEPNIEMRAFIGQDFIYRGEIKPYEDNVVISFRVKDINYKKGTAYCSLLRTYYAYSPLPSGVTFNITMDNTGNEEITSYLVKNRAYVAQGTFIASTQNKVRIFSIEPFNTSLYTDKEYRDCYRELMGSDWITEDDVQWLKLQNGLFPNNLLLDVTENFDTYALDEFNPDSVAGTNVAFLTSEQVTQCISYAYMVRNNSVPLDVTDHVEAIPAFQQGKTFLSSGRFYTPADGANVCVISEPIATQLNLKVGDTLPVSMHYSVNKGGVFDSYFPTTGFTNKGEYKIVGIYKNIDDLFCNIFIPRTGNTDWLPASTMSYTLGRFIIKNGTGLDYVDSLGTKLTGRLEMGIYDQGYIAIAEPLQSMRETSYILLGASAACAVAILLLFAFMFVNKQSGEVTTMLNLGAGERKARRFLFTTALILALVATIAGGVIGYFTSDKILQLAYDNAIAKSAIDLRYSSFYTGETTPTFEIKFTTDMIVVLITSACILILTMLCTQVFINNLIIGRRIEEWNKPDAKSRRFFGTFGIAYRSMVRNSGRSVIVPVVSLCIVILLMLYCVTLNDYSSKIEGIYDNTETQAYFTNTSGKRIDDLLLEGGNAQAILDSGYVSYMHYTYQMKYFYRGCYQRIVDDEGKVSFSDYYSVAEYVIPNTGFQREFAFAGIVQWKDLIFTNDIAKSPELYFTANPTIVYFEDYSAKSFLEDREICAVSTQFAKENGLKLGDKISLMIANRDSGAFSTDKVTLTVAAVYVKQSTAEDIFCPIKLLRNWLCGYQYEAEAGNLSYHWGVGEHGEIYYYTINEAQNDVGAFLTENADSEEYVPSLSGYSKLSSLGFTLKDSSQLTEFKQWLQDKGYGTRSRLGRNRLSIIINDTSLINSVTSLSKVEGYMRALYPVIFALTAAIGFVVSYLITKSRRAELAIMRSMGSGSVKAFSAFFIEQITLCVLGGGVGLLIAWLIFRFQFVMLIWGSLLLYLACYFVGTAISTMLMNKLNVLRILSAKE